MNEYDIEKAFAAIEEELIASMMRNMKRHKEWELDEGFQWTMWQAEQLKALDKYKKQNSKKFQRKFNEINRSIKELIEEARKQGNMDQELEILDAIQNGWKPPRRLSSDMTTAAEFFKLNTRKLEALITATENDFKKAETAMLRMANDQYRQVIFNAQVYANTGAGTYKKAVDMATRDFRARGINCIEYKNGARHTMKDYARMAIRTASKRAYLTGEGEKRQEWGISTVIMNKRGNPCPLCLPFVGKIMIDDVWSGGKAEDGPYPLMSSAVAAGLYHPNCKDSHSTYFPGINGKPSDSFTLEEIEQIKEQYYKEQKKQYAARQLEKYRSLANNALDEENKVKYKRKALEWKDKLFALKTSSKSSNVTTEIALKEVSKSSIIDMQSTSEIIEYFADTYGVTLEGFEDKELLNLKIVMAGFDDALSLFPDARDRMKKISFDKTLKDYGKINEFGHCKIGIKGLGNYGTGIHETIHALDFAISKPGTNSFSENILKRVRKELKLKRNSKQYTKLGFDITGSFVDATDDSELLAYAVETEIGKGKANILSQTIYQILMEML